MDFYIDPQGIFEKAFTVHVKRETFEKIDDIIV